MFAVVNHRKGPGKDPIRGPGSLAEVRRFLGIPAPDLSKVNVNAEEQKYKIQAD